MNTRIAQSYRISASLVGVLSLTICACAMAAERVEDGKAGSAAQPVPSEAQLTTQIVAKETGWKAFIPASSLKKALDAGEVVRLIDVRSAGDYAKGHIPGSINIPGALWRSQKAKPGEGLGEDVFALPDGTPDAARYEKLLGEAGVKHTDNIVVYGKPGGTAEGLVPVFILDLLGVANVRFVEGEGAQEWVKTGGTLSTTPTVLPKATFAAKPKSGVLWNLDKVLGNIKNSEVVFWDCRTPEEFSGKDLRGNQRGGRIPGSKWLDSRVLVDAEQHSISQEELKAKLTAAGITPDKTIVIYCQTGTRCTLPYFQLKELGYEKVAFYDASWLEYGNRTDTPVEK